MKASPLKTLTGLLMYAIAHTAMAGSGMAKIDTLLAGPEYGPRLFVGMSGVSGRPSCSNNPSFAFVIDSSLPHAKTWVAMLQVAYATGRSVQIEGQNTCSLYPDTEDVRYIWVK